MKRLILLVLCLQAAVFAYSQDSLKKELDSERIANFYSNRKYTFGIAESLYGNLARYHPFGVFDIVFSDRLTWLNLAKNASLEATVGIGFEPYQGTHLHIGGDYELLSKANKFNLYLGLNYALGLAQATTMENNSNIYMGYHNYLIPFVGCMYWPHKKDIRDELTGSIQDAELNRNPGFWQLFYFKFQVSYSFLISSLQADTSGGFDPHLFQMIKRNTFSTVVFKFGIGINIPTTGRKHEDYNQFRARKQAQNVF